MATLKLEGGLADEGALPGVLRSIHAGRRSGMLHATRGGDRVSLCFVRGEIAYGSTSVKAARLGETLVLHGLITEWDHARAYEMVEVTGRRLGQILLDLGILDEERLEEALALHTREMLLEMVSWREGAYRFEEQDPEAFRGYGKPLKLSTGELILDAVWSIADPDVVRLDLGDLDRVLAQTRDPLLRSQTLNLNSTDGFLLSRVDGVATARQVLALAPVPPEEAERSLLALLYTGLIEYVAEPQRPAGAASRARAQEILEAWGELPRQNHYEVLGLEHTATAAGILAAYSRLAKRYHPEAHREPGLEGLKDKIAVLFARVTEAHGVLSNPLSRAAYAKTLQRPAPPAPVPEPAPETPVATPAPSAPTLAEAERSAELLGRGEEALHAGQVLQALALAGEALPLTTGRARRRARVLKTHALLAGAGTKKDAEEELKVAIEENPGHAEAHYLLGKIYREGGAIALATAAFKRALLLRPRYEEPLLELASLQRPEESRGGGVLKKLFK